MAFVMMLQISCNWLHLFQDLRRLCHGEGIDYPEDDIEGREVIEAFLENIECFLKGGSVNKRETKINMRLSTFKSWIMFLPNGLDLLIVLLDSKGEVCVMHQLEVVYGLHKQSGRYGRLQWTFLQRLVFIQNNSEQLLAYGPAAKNYHIRSKKHSFIDLIRIQFILNKPLLKRRLCQKSQTKSSSKYANYK